MLPPVVPCNLLPSAPPSAHRDISSFCFSFTIYYTIFLRKKHVIYMSVILPILTTVDGPSHTNQQLLFIHKSNDGKQNSNMF